MIKAIAIDDEPMPLNILRRYAEQTEKINLLETFNATVAASEWLKNNEVDLLFLDINMPSVSGLDFFAPIRNDFMVIFTTAHSEFAVEGFNLDAIDYLLKPFSFERFAKAVSKAVDYHKFRAGLNVNEIFVKSNNSILKIPSEEILFVEAYADYLKIHRTGKKKVITRMTMNNIEELLPKEFVRVHRSFIVPFSRVEQMINRQIIIQDHNIPIGKTYYKRVQGLLSQ